jgi:hypothetical protein
MRNLILASAMAVIALNAVSAQQVTDFRKPGDVIRVEIKFDGPDAGKIKQLSISLNKPDGQVPKDQIGFSTNFGSNWVQESLPLTFRVEVTIPPNIATGDYVLNVNAQAENGRTQYESGNQFKLPPFHIRNDKTFVPPMITVTERR